MEDGSSLHDIDVVVFCTGYIYNFPFLPCTSNNNTPPPTPPTPSTSTTSTNSEKLQKEKKKKSSTLISENKYLNISADGHCVNHLIGHVFPTPSKTSLDHLAFVGLPYNVVPFHLYELQSRWIGETILSKSKNKKNKNNENQKKENKTKVVRDSDKAVAGNDADAGTNVLPRKITSAVFASGDNDRHAHRLGDLQWEYCHSILQELTDSNSSTTTTTNDDDDKKQKKEKKQEEDVITNTNTDVNTDAKQQDVHQQKKNVHDQPTQPSDVLNNTTAEETTYKGEAIGRFVVLLAPPTSNKYSSSSQTQILPVSIQSEGSVHRVMEAL